MLDGFHQHHSRLVFRDHNRVRLSEAAFRAARRAATKSLVPLDRTFLRGNSAFERHRLFYEFHLTKEMDAFPHKDLSGEINLTLVEVVILQNFLRIEEASELRNSSSVARSVAVLGWMIQERLQYILLQTGNESIQELMEFRRVRGISTRVWESRLVGAAAETKAIMHISRARGLRLYPSTLMDDVDMGIDFFVETLNGNGACVSVKTDVDGRTQFLLESAVGYEQAWSRIKHGSQDFRESTHRDWRPILLLMGKARGEAFNLYQKPGRLSPWVMALEHAIDDTLQTNELVLTA